MNRAQRRALARRGKRRTKPPVPHVKPKLAGKRATEARQTFLQMATSAGEFQPSQMRPALVSLLRAEG